MTINANYHPVRRCNTDDQGDRTGSSRSFSAARAPLITEGDALKRDNFLENHAVRKKRYLSYLVDLGMIRSQYKDLQKESMRITGTQGNEDKLNFFMGNNFSKFKETELWHVDEYP